MGAVVAVAVAVAFITWLAVRHFDSGSGQVVTSAQAAAATPFPVSADELARTGLALGRPIYWAGPKPRTTYELTQEADGRTYVRYLPPGVPLGNPAPVLTVGTYPMANAYIETQKAAEASGAVTIPSGSGAIAFYQSSTPTNVYEAFPGSSYQIEVFSPSAQQAQQIVSGGEVVAAGGALIHPTGPVAATAARLAREAKTLGRPIYWAGVKPRTTYELTVTSNGRVYIRYLPAGARIGTNVGYLTVGTYPLANAYAVTAAAAAAPGEVEVPLKGAVAFYGASRPQSIYIAFRGSSEQIEVYDPSSGAPVSLVRSGTVATVP